MWMLSLLAKLARELSWFGLQSSLKAEIMTPGELNGAVAREQPLGHSGEGEAGADTRWCEQIEYARIIDVIWCPKSDMSKKC